MRYWFDEAEAVDKILSATDRESFYWKYVRINGKYLFAPAMDPFSPSHKSALKKDEKPESAAFVIIQTINGIKVRVEGWSISLNIGPTQNDESRLVRLFNFRADSVPSHDLYCCGGENCECITTENIQKPDSAAIFGAAIGLWETIKRSGYLDLPEYYEGGDELMRRVMQTAASFEAWSCKNVAFEGLDDPWPYLLEDRFGIAIGSLHYLYKLGTLSDQMCGEIATYLCLPLYRQDL